jgi:ppGpp synthetase/RelA/SpoT-type nucleotidyltranferase
LLKKDEFLKKFRIEEKILVDQNIDWDVLKEIHDDFIQSKDKYETHAAFISDVLRGQRKVHTVRSRVKDPEHLIAKLIRKTTERKDKNGSDFQFTMENYKDEITDLIGVRAIHIFKEDWLEIHEFICSTWTVNEVKANVREGDSTDIFDELKIEIDKRKTGYRSVHYLIEFSPTIQKVTAEIQVRTIFEEGYGEIDHQLRYPHNDVPEVLELNLLMLNRVAGSSDEMASFINHLKNSWEEMVGNYEKQVKELKQIIEKSTMKKEEKLSVISGIEGIKKNFNNDLLKSSVNIASYKPVDMSAITTAMLTPNASSLSSALGSLSSMDMSAITIAMQPQNTSAISSALSGLGTVDMSAITNAMQPQNTSVISSAFSGPGTVDMSVITNAMQPQNTSVISSALNGLTVDTGAVTKELHTANLKTLTNPPKSISPLTNSHKSIGNVNISMDNTNFSEVKSNKE